MLALTGATVKDRMAFALAAALAGASLPAHPSPSSKIAAVVVTARIYRAGEASGNSMLRHPAHRVREIIERTPDGREYAIVVADFE